MRGFRSTVRIGNEVVATAVAPWTFLNGPVFDDSFRLSAGGLDFLARLQWQHHAQIGMYLSLVRLQRVVDIAHLHAHAQFVSTHRRRQQTESAARSEIDATVPSGHSVLDCTGTDEQQRRPIEWVERIHRL